VLEIAKWKQRRFSAGTTATDDQPEEQDFAALADDMFGEWGSI